jgi:hypothetical protein
MKKVITERPRGGGGIKTPKGERRAKQRLALDELPRREQIRAKWERGHGNKHFTDVLGPLYRFLLKQVGRPWDAVYSEIARHLPKTSVQNRHIYTHLWQFVEKNVIIVDGAACFNDGRSHGVPIKSAGRYAQLYVNPVTGLLCKAKKGRGRYGYPWFRPEPIQPGIKVYPGVQYHKVKGVWYEVRVRKYPTSRDPLAPATPDTIKDDVLGHSYRGLEELARVYGGNYLAVSKRLLKKREIRFAGLT